MWEMGSLQSPMPVEPPTARTCMGVGGAGRQVLEHDRPGTAERLGRAVVGGAVLDPAIEPFRVIDGNDPRLALSALAVIDLDDLDLFHWRSGSPAFTEAAPTAAATVFPGKKIHFRGFCRRNKRFVRRLQRFAGDAQRFFGRGKSFFASSKGLAGADETSTGAAEGSGRASKPLGTTTKGLFRPEKLRTR